VQVQCSCSGIAVGHLRRTHSQSCSAGGRSQPAASIANQTCSAGGRCSQAAAARTHLWRLGWVVFREFHGQGVEAPLPQRALLAGDEAFPLHQVGLTAGQRRMGRVRHSGGWAGSGWRQVAAAQAKHGAGAHPLSVVSGRAWNPKGLSCRGEAGARRPFSGHRLKTHGLRKRIPRGTAPSSTLAAPQPACCALLPPCCNVLPPDRFGWWLSVRSRVHTDQCSGNVAVAAGTGETATDAITQVRRSAGPAQRRRGNRCS
jgi:hypothetical protein